METTNNEPLQFLESLVEEKREACELRLQEHENQLAKFVMANDEYVELSRQLQILSQKDEDYKVKNESYESQFQEKVKLNNELRNKVIKTSCELKYTLDEFSINEDKYNCSNQEEISLRESSISLEADLTNIKERSTKQKKELAEIRKTQRFYTLRIKQLSIDLAEEKLQFRKIEATVEKSKSLLQKCHFISTKLDAKIKDVRFFSDKKRKDAERLMAQKKEETRKLNKKSTYLKETKKKGKIIYQQLIENNNQVKLRRQEQDEVLRLLKDENNKLAILSEKEKIMKANIAKMSNNDTKLNKEINRIEKTKLFYSENQIKLKTALNEKISIIKEKIDEVECLKKELVIEKDQTTHDHEKYKSKRDDIVKLKQQSLNLSNEILLTKNENENVKTQIKGFNNEIKNLSERYHSKISELKSIENLLHSNVSLYENCKREINLENI